MNLRRASATLASGTLVSRLLGFVSLILLTYSLGAIGAGANAFAVANFIPNMVYAIVAGGTVNAVLIPQIIRFSRQPDGGQRYINRIATLALTLFAGLTVVIVLLAPWLVRIFAGAGFDESTFELATAFAYWCLPQVFFYAMYSVLGEVLNARKIFGPFTWTPVLNNLVFITGLLIFLVFFGPYPPGGREISFWAPGLIALIGAFATAGIALQAIGLLFFWRRAGLRFRLSFRWKNIELARSGRVFSWTFGMVLMTSLAGLIETNISTLAGNNEASVAVMQRAWLLFMLPHSLIAVSIATPYFTRMSEHAAARDWSAYRRDLSEAIRIIALGIVGSSVFIAVLALPLSRIFVSRPDILFAMAASLLAYLTGLLAFSVLFLVQRAFYALSDTRTPFLLAAVHSVLVTVGSLLSALMPPAYIVIALAAVSSGSMIIQCLLGVKVLKSRVGDFDLAHIRQKLARYSVGSVPAGIVGMAMVYGLMLPILRSGVLGSIFTLVVVGLVMLPIYLLTLKFMRCDEAGFYADFLPAAFRRLSGLSR